jgi:hypothetical protein
MFLLQFLLPSSGKFSNVSAKIFSNIFLNFINEYLKELLKMKANILVETFENFSEDGIKKSSRKP